MTGYAVDFTFTYEDNNTTACAIAFEKQEVAKKFYDYLTDLDDLSEEDCAIQIAEAFEYCMQYSNKYFTNIEDLYFYKNKDKYFKYDDDVYKIVNDYEIQINGYMIEDEDD